MYAERLFVFRFLRALSIDWVPEKTNFRLPTEDKLSGVVCTEPAHLIIDYKHSLVIFLCLPADFFEIIAVGSTNGVPDDEERAIISYVDEVMVVVVGG